MKECQNWYIHLILTYFVNILLHIFQYHTILLRFIIFVIDRCCLFIQNQKKTLEGRFSNQYSNNLRSKSIHASLFILQTCDKKSSSMISLRRKLLLWEIKLPHRLKVEHFFGVNAKTLYQIWVLLFTLLTINKRKDSERENFYERKFLLMD